MPSVSRTGDAHACPQTGHSVNNIVSGADNVFINGVPAARVGDTTSCGATIITGSSTVTINGMPAAIMGSVTSHGGVIIGGSGNVLIGDTYIPPSQAGVKEPSPLKAFTQHFQFIDETGKPTDGFTYLISTPHGDVIGDVCNEGKTEIIQSDAEITISLAHMIQHTAGIR